MYLPIELFEPAASASKKLSKYLKEYYMERYSYMNQKIDLKLDLAPATQDVEDALCHLEENDPQVLLLLLLITNL